MVLKPFQYHSHFTLPLKGSSVPILIHRKKSLEVLYYQEDIFAPICSPNDSTEMQGPIIRALHNENKYPYPPIM